MDKAAGEVEITPPERHQLAAPEASVTTEKNDDKFPGSDPRR